MFWFVTVLITKSARLVLIEMSICIRIRIRIDSVFSPVKSCWVQSPPGLRCARACPCIATVVLNLCVMMEAKCDARVKGKKESDSFYIWFDCCR